MMRCGGTECRRGIPPRTSGSRLRGLRRAAAHAASSLPSRGWNEFLTGLQDKRDEFAATLHIPSSFEADADKPKSFRTDFLFGKRQLFARVDPLLQNDFAVFAFRNKH